LSRKNNEGKNKFRIFISSKTLVGIYVFEKNRKTEIGRDKTRPSTATLEVRLPSEHATRPFQSRRVALWRQRWKKEKGKPPGARASSPKIMLI
jgi:hypothetical protein